MEISENINKNYILKESLLTPAEKEFSKILEQVVGDNYRIERQVQMSRIVKVMDSNADYTNYKDFNRIKAKTIDFVLLNTDDKPCIAIELDDKTHSRWDRIRRDMFVDGVMKGVGLPIIHIPVADSYNFEKLKEKISQLR